MLQTKTCDERLEERINEVVFTMVSVKAALLKKSAFNPLDTSTVPGPDLSIRERAHPREVGLIAELTGLAQFVESEIRRLDKSMYQESWGLRPWQERKTLLLEHADLCRLRMVLWTAISETVSILNGAAADVHTN